MTDQLPWLSREEPGRPGAPSPDGAGGGARRGRAVVEDDLGLDLRFADTPDAEQARPDQSEDRDETWHWSPSPGEWSQPRREEVSSRRRLREAEAGAPPGPAAAPVRPSSPGPRDTTGLPESTLTPSTGELEVYGPARRDVRHRSARRDETFPDVQEHGAGRGDALRAGVERWSRWAAGLGLPPREPSGTRRYPARENLLPPAVWLTAALAVAVLVGLVTGVLVSGGSDGSGAATAIGTTATVTVTNATTAPPVTATTTLTRTRTSTVTETATPTDAGQGGAPAGQGLGPGSQGPAVARLQLELAQLGLYQGGPSGNYDQQTQAAVQNFQARAGITADPPGVAGPTTRQALNQAVGR